MRKFAMKTKDQNVLAIIPARANSKRIKQKNIRPFYGRPIIEYSISAAIKSKLFDEVMVSTDSKDIERCAVENGAMVPFMRSAKNSDDFATLADVMIEVLHSYATQQKYFDIVCCILPTAPFITSNVLVKSFAKFSESTAKSLIPVVEYQQAIQRSFKINNGQLSMFWPEFYITRSQDLEKAYYDAGQFYWVKALEIEKNYSLITDQTIPFILSSSEVQDIDTEQDWALAEKKFAHVYGSQSVSIKDEESF